MTKLNDLQLTDEEMREALPYVRALADTATEKAVRGVALWLRSDSTLWDMAGLKIADALDAMLAEEKAHA